MSRRCDICGRGSKKMVRRSHSNIATLDRQYVNLQPKTINGERKKICTNCLKTLVKKKKVKKVKTPKAKK